MGVRAAGVGMLDPEDKAALGRMRQGASLRELAADIDLLKLSLSEKVGRGEVHSVVNDAMRAREAAAVHSRLAHQTDGVGEPALARASGASTNPHPAAEPASLSVKWDQDARRASVSLSAPMDPLPPPSVPSILTPVPNPRGTPASRLAWASLSVDWDREARLATMSLGIPALWSVDQNGVAQLEADGSREIAPELEYQPDCESDSHAPVGPPETTRDVASEPTDMLWM
jgi:hypothetical protein